MMLAQPHLKQLQSLLNKGYTSQLLFCSQLPLSLKIPSLISCRMYEQAICELLKQDKLASPLHVLWLVICCHMVDTNYDQYYQQLVEDKEQKYKQLADDWIKMYRPIIHPVQVKSVMRKKFQELLLLAQQQNYFNTSKMPVFLVSCSWLQKFYNNNLTFIPPVDNSNLYTPMPYIQVQPKYLHYNYKLNQTCKQNIDYKIIPFQAWQYLCNNFGGMQFRRFTTNQKQPICQLSYLTLKVVVVENRYMFGLRVFQILVGRFDTIATVVDRVKRIMLGYGIIQFQSLKSVWEPILVSRIDFDELADIIQDQQRDLIKESSPLTHQLYRLQTTHDIQDSQYNNVSDILLFNLHKNNTSFLDIHSIPFKKTIKKYNKCLTCSTTEQLEECVCKQAYFCCKQCRDKNKQHLKICANLMKQDSIVERLIDVYGVNKRTYKYSEIKRGGKVGLQNLGNTCYLNAALQCVLTVDVLNQFFVSNDYVKQLNVTNVLGSSGNLACAYGEFIKEYFTTNRRALQPYKILKIISGKNAQFRGHNHQDSQEFFNYFFDKLHEDLNRIRDKPYVENIESDGRPDQIVSELSWRNYLKRNNSFISENFAGQYRSEIRCPDCDRISITFDPFLSVTLPFPRKEPQEQITGYFLTQQGGFQKIEKRVKASMPGEQFLEKFFHEPVHPLWLKQKQPFFQWKNKKSVSSNNPGKGVLIFYPKPSDSTVQIQVRYHNFDIFHRKIFTTQINSVEDLMKILYKYLKTPILRATKKQELIKMQTQEFVKACEQAKFLEIEQNSVKEYPFQKGILKVKLRINKQLIPWQLVDPIKFDLVSKSYEPKTLMKQGKSIGDKLTVKQLLQSFSEPEQLTEENSWYCNKCKQHKLAQKIMSVYKTAKYLVVHLKRFNHSGNRYIIYGEKVRTPIQLEKVEIINGEKYELFGVVNHFGSLSMGHYTAFVNREGEWYYADDSSFKRRQVDGDDAYLLFYRRI